MTQANLTGFAPTWSSRWCTYGKHWAETAAGGETRKWKSRWCPDCAKAYDLAYYRANRESRIAFIQSRYYSDIEKSRAASRATYHRLKASNPDRFRDATRGYRLRRKSANSEQVLAYGRYYSRLRRARKRNAVCKHGQGCFDNAAETALANAKKRCAMCGTRNAEWQADHIVALANGGIDCKFNFQLLCKPCNSGKQARPAKDGAQGTLI